MPDHDHPPGTPLPTPWPLDDHPDPAAAALRETLAAAYADAGRDYHDTRHLAEVLARLEELAGHGARFDTVTVGLAAWFHDSVYDGERDAEERSATWAEDALPGLVDDAVVAEVARLVRMTETHHPEPEDAGGCALSDADLAILAADTDRYADYVTAVRREYAHVGDDDFARGRTSVLEDLLAKDRLFHTAWATTCWEEPARANILAELEEIAARAETLPG